MGECIEGVVVEIDVCVVDFEFGVFVCEWVGLIEFGCVFEKCGVYGVLFVRLFRMLSRMLKVWF